MLKFKFLQLQMRIFLLLITVIIAACASHKIGTSTHGLVLEDLLKQKSQDPADVVKWMQRCSKECRSPDREIALDLADGYSSLVDAAAKNPRMSDLSLEQKKQIGAGQAKIRRAFLKILEVKEGRDILETSYRELANPDSIYYGIDVEVQKSVKTAIDRLKQKPETLATSWYLKAISTPQTSENVVELIEDYRACVKIAQSQKTEDMACRGSYEELVRFYERPRCQEPHFNADLKFDTEIDSAKKNILTGTDLLESTLESIGPDHWEIWFTLKTFSSKKLEDFTTVAKVQEGESKTIKRSLIMNLSNIELARAPVSQKIADGTFRMVFENIGLAKQAFDKICKAQNPEKLPEELRL